jgi:hypothetical protein
MDWRKITLPPSATEIPEPVGIISPVKAIYTAQNRPKDFCVFLAINPSDRAIYFSPVAAKLCLEFIGRLRDLYDVSDCDAPVNEPVELYVGDFESDACMRLLK